MCARFQVTEMANIVRGLQAGWLAVCYCCPLRALCVAIVGMYLESQMRQVNIECERGQGGAKIVECYKGGCDYMPMQGHGNQSKKRRGLYFIANQIIVAPEYPND